MGRSGRRAGGRSAAPAVLAIILLGGCLSTNDGFKRTTANVVGLPSTDGMTISYVYREATRVTWDADTPKGHFTCSKSELLPEAYCNKRGVRGR